MYGGPPAGSVFIKSSLLNVISQGVSVLGVSLGVPLS